MLYFVLFCQLSPNKTHRFVGVMYKVQKGSSRFNGFQWYCTPIRKAFSKKWDELYFEKQLNESVCMCVCSFMCDLHFSWHPPAVPTSRCATLPAHLSLTCGPEVGVVPGSRL
ncbi:hypothetical protein ILYODFUR_017412 [Ilyodon furcidens]|uniref:Uncharacterized protein n=1 Tax=Ilyodon furcidens TaxID=33524 RepID=A0ABV0VH65_9TELE